MNTQTVNYASFLWLYLSSCVLYIMNMITGGLELLTEGHQLLTGGFHIITGDLQLSYGGPEMITGDSFEKYFTCVPREPSHYSDCPLSSLCWNKSYAVNAYIHIYIYQDRSYALNNKTYIYTVHIWCIPKYFSLLYPIFTSRKHCLLLCHIDVVLALSMGHTLHRWYNNVHLYEMRANGAL